MLGVKSKTYPCVWVQLLKGESLWARRELLQPVSQWVEFRCLTQRHTIKIRAATTAVSLSTCEGAEEKAKGSLLPKDAWNPEGFSFPK